MHPPVRDVVVSPLLIQYQVSLSLPLHPDRVWDGYLIAADPFVHPVQLRAYVHQVVHIFFSYWFIQPFRTPVCWFPPTKVTPFFLFTNFFHYFFHLFSTPSVPGHISPTSVGNFSLTPKGNIFRNFSRHFLRITHHALLSLNLTDLDT